MSAVDIPSLTTVLDTYRDLLASDTLADETWCDIVETTTNDSTTITRAVPHTHQFFYVLDTASMSLEEIAKRAEDYQRHMDAFTADIEANDIDPSTVRSWDYFEEVVGEGTWGTMPPGITVVVNDQVESYAYSTISDFAARHQLIVVA